MHFLLYNEGHPTQLKAVSFILVNMFFQINGTMQVPFETCIVNAYCQFSQQARTNFMQTYLDWLLPTCFFILSRGDPNGKKFPFANGNFFQLSVFARIMKMGSDNENSHTRLSLVLSNGRCLWLLHFILRLIQEK